MNIVIISGSPRKGSLTNRIALHLESHFSEKTNHAIQVVNLQETVLPHIQQVWSSVDNAPEEFKPLAKIMFEADVFVLVTPEYNGSYSPALKNLLDHFPKQHRKPFGIATGSPGGFGGLRATQQIFPLVAALFGYTCPYMLVVPFADKKFDEIGNLLDPAFQSSVDQFTAEFLFLAERITVKEPVTV
jgi:NAD(P)H-dependent FMN reductase